MIQTGLIIGADDFMHKAREKAIRKLNIFIQEEKIERDNILEFRTEEQRSTKVGIKNVFKVVIFWWK